jgi:membrane-bound lytic murein transglycosylase D
MVKASKKIIFAATALLIAATLARAQFNLGGLFDKISNLSDEYEFDPTVIGLPDPEDWSGFWNTVTTTMQSESLEDLAWLRPYAEQALLYLDDVEAAGPYADWLRQRVDYMWMAEEILEEERRKPPVVTPTPPAPGRPLPPAPPPARPPPPSRPPPPPATKTGKIKPPPHKPAPKSPPEVNRKTMDIDRWVRRIEGRPAPANAAKFVPQLSPIFRKHGVPDTLVWLAEVESSFDPEAKSPVGALGLYQFMPATAERFGLKLKPSDERIVPSKSAEAAAQYLKVLHGRFGSWPLALAAYNAGEGRVGKLLKKHGASTFEGIAEYLPAETRMYVPKIAAVVRVRAGADLNAL